MTKDSKREKIVQAVIERLELIRIANGFETDIGENVADWATNWDASELPALSVHDLDEKRSNESPEEEIDLLILPIQIRVALLENARAKEARKMIAEILKALKDDLHLGGLAVRIEFNRAGLMVSSEDDFRLAGAAVEIEVHYFIKRFDYYG